MKTCPNGQELKIIINNQLMDLQVPADTTILEAVRDLGLTGTKEGCASGDCGACTVMVGEPIDGQMKYHTINACIAPMGQQAHRHLVTVEGLESAGQLHPAQAEMVNSHGSQCGFCTPGFVMSLAAMVEQGTVAERDEVLQGISGNLCRCTGYRPIVEAGLAALESEPKHEIPGQELAMSLASAQPESESANVLLPQNESELQTLMTNHPGAKLIAGGTDLMLEVTQRYVSMPELIDLSRVEELRQVTTTSESLVIGASVPYTELESLFESHSPAFVDLLHRLGSRQIRNSGTLGGNLANGSPIADTPPVLIVWDAGLELVDADGQVRHVSISDFYRGYRDTVLAENEYIARIHVPLSALDSFHRCYKSSKRLEDDISSVMGAFRFVAGSEGIGEARVAFGGMAATPVRLTAIEEQLLNTPLTDELIQTVTEELRTQMTPLSDVRASSGYRMEMAVSMLARALAEFRGDARPVITEVSI